MVRFGKDCLRWKRRDEQPGKALLEDFPQSVEVLHAPTHLKVALVVKCFHQVSEAVAVLLRCANKDAGILFLLVTEEELVEHNAVVLANLGSFVRIFGVLRLVLEILFVFLLVFELLFFALIVVNDNTLVFFGRLQLCA